MPAAQFEIWIAQRRSAHFLQQSLWDVAHFCEELERATTSDDVTTAARTVRDALQPGPENFVLAEAHHGARVEKCGGVTVVVIVSCG